MSLRTLPGRLATLTGALALGLVLGPATVPASALPAPDRAAATTSPRALPTCAGSEHFLHTPRSDGGVYYTHMPSYFRSEGCVLAYNLTYNYQVVALQQALVRCYPGLTYNFVIDGKYGARTRDAIKVIQNAKGITVDGKWGPQTARVMLWPVHHGTGASERYLGYCN